MHRWIRTVVTLSFAVSVSAWASDAIELRSIYGSNHNVEELLGGDVKGAVFVFARPDCPAVDLAVPELERLQRAYADKKIPFYAVYSFAGVNRAQMALHAQSVRSSLRAFLDVDQRLAKKWGVTRTAVAVVVSPAGNVVFKGAVLDADRSGAATPKHLKAAIDQWLAGEKVAVTETAGQGCLINTRKRAPLSGLTFHKDIAPILQAKCQRCHRKGEVAPMPLETYDEVTTFASMIGQVVEDRTMPPWPAHSPHAIENDASLTADETRKILSWIESDTPEGDPKDAPKPLSWPDPAKWSIEPTYTFKSRAYEVPATGIVPYIYTRHAIPLAADGDIFLEALEVKPGARRTVHHVAIHEFPYGEKPITAVDLVKIYGLEISNNILGAYVPGIAARVLPPGHAIRIRKGMGVMIDAHYTPYGTVETDVTQLGIRVTKTPPKREVFSRWFYRSRGRFEIPRGADHHVMSRDDISFEKDIEILEMRPHLHARGKSFLVEKQSPVRGDVGRRSETVLALPRWDFNWQYDYKFKEPLKLKGGESLKITAVWDNTKFNPTNPDPTVDVVFGEQTGDEMMGLLLVWREAETTAGVGR